MLKTYSVVLLALAMSIGVAQARHVIPGCAVGQPAAAKCACGLLPSPKHASTLQRLPSSGAFTKGSCPDF
jgi:hypothetical protein